LSNTHVAPITACFENQTINLLLPLPTPFASLQQTLSQTFGLSSLEKVILKYQDDEAEFITLDTDQELVHALDIMKHGLVLRVIRQESEDKNNTKKRKQPRKEKEVFSQASRKKCRQAKGDQEKKRFQDVALENEFQLESWPKDVTHLYVDGSNLVWIHSHLRKLVLAKKFTVVESIFTELVKQFAQKTNLKCATLIFDVSKTETVQQLGDCTVVVCSARPSFNTSDDALVAWAQKEPQIAQAAAYITSDRELHGRLVEAKAKYVIRPKSWFNFVAPLIGFPQKELSDWLEEFITAIVAKAC